VPLRKQLKKELEILIYKRQGGATSSVLGQFNIKEPVEDIKLNTIVDDIERLALTL